jgi:hypothetical protein
MCTEPWRGGELFARVMRLLMMVVLIGALL